MEIGKHYVAESALLTIINQKYAINGVKIRLYRISQGQVFFIQTPTGRKVFKLYLPTCSDSAIQTTHVISYMDKCDYPVVQIIPTVTGELFVTLDMPEGSCIGVLFEYANGICIGFLHRWRTNKQPLVHPLTRQFGRQVGLMHRLMEHYNGPPLVHRGSKERVFGDLVSLMRRDNYDEVKTRNIEEYGNELWNILKKCPTGYFHADMHTGNTKYHNGKFIWMDFDRASISYPIMDIGWLLEIDWLCFHEESLDRSRSLFEEIYNGYTLERPLTDGEIAAVFHSVAMIHYEGVASNTIMKNKKLETWLMDREYEWLMRWRECCSKLE
ncbi:MAG: phosphotransferase [Dehalococcoidales bacterium]|nr:phosphotransferase [Dehalococcoidales bacterium]